MNIFQIHFTKYDKNRAKQSGTIREAGCHSGNSTICTILTEGTTRSSVSILIKLITCQTMKNAAQFRKMIDLLKLQVVNNVPGTRNTRGGNNGEKNEY